MHEKQNFTYFTIRKKESEGNNMKYFLKFFIAVFVLVLIVGCGGTSWQLRSGRIAIKEQDWERAIKNLDEEIARMPENPEAWYLKGYAYMKLDEYSKMSNAFEKSLEYGDQFEALIKISREKLVNQYYSKFSAAFDSLEYDKALAYIDTAITINPHDPELYFQAGVAAFNAEMDSLALKYADEAVKRMPEDEENIELRRLVLLVNRRMNNTEGIIEAAQKLMETIDLNTDTTDYYLLALDDLVMAYEAQGEAEKAEQMIHDAISHFPEVIELKLNLATLMVRREDFDAAMEIYKDVLRQNPDHKDANLAVGIMLANKKEYTEAIPYLEKVLEEDPDNMKAIQSLGSCYYNTGNEGKGKQMIQRLKELQGG